MYSLLEFIADRKSEIVLRTIEHIRMTGISVSLAIVVGVPLGILLTRKKKLHVPVMSVLNCIQAVPSLALLGFLIPVLGIGSKPAIVALFLYSILAITKNTATGIAQVDGALLEAGRGMGMTDGQMLRKIELPLAIPVIFAGIRIATVTCIGIATLCAAIGAGGLGQFIFRGISMVNNKMILAGAFPAALLAILTDVGLHILERKVTPYR